MNSSPMQDQLYDIYGVWHIPWWQTWYFYAALMITFLLIFAVIVWVLIKSWLKKRSLLKPWQKALRDLDALNKKNVLNNPKEFYSRLTAVLKNYLLDRYQYQIMDKTDDELLAYLAEHDFSPALQEQLQAIFSRAIASKFAAESSVSIESMRNDLLMSSMIIEQTIPKKAS